MIGRTFFGPGGKSQVFTAATTATSELQNACLNRNSRPAQRTLPDGSMLTALQQGVGPPRNRSPVSLPFVEREICDDESTPRLRTPLTPCDKEKTDEARSALTDKSRVDFIPKTNAIMVDGKSYCGATKTLKSVFYPNYKRPVVKRCSRKVYEKRRFEIQRTSSSKSEGDMFHRHVYHFYNCQKGVVKIGMQRTRCAHCKEKFGVYCTTVTNFCNIWTMIDTVNDMVKSEGLELVACETPVAWRRINAGTLLDAVCIDREGKLVVMEFKTGYSVRTRTKPSSIDKRGKMVGKAGRKIANHPLNHHFLQLWFGVQALRDTHDQFEVRDGILAYIDNCGGYDLYYLSGWKLGRGLKLEHLEEQLYRVHTMKERWE